MEKIYLNICGFNILLKVHYTDQPYHLDNFVGMVKKNYSGFIKRGKGKVDFTVHVDYTGSVLLKIDKKKNSEVEYFDMRSSYLDIPKRTLFFNNPPGGLDFEFGLSIILNKYLIPNSNGMALHGSAVSYKNKAFIFEGRNGAGKSTTAQMLNGLCNISADDSIVIRKIKGRFYLFQTIIHDKNYNFKKGWQSYTVDRIFFIKKAKEYKIQKIENKNMILNKILKQIFTYPDMIKRQFPLLVEFANTKDFYYLYVKKDEKEFKKFFKKEILKI